MARTSNKDPYSQAVRWLSYHDYSVHDPSARLVRAGFPESAVDEAIGRLQDKGWLDDAKVAKQLIDQSLRSGTMGPALIVQKVAAKNIARDIWEPLWAEMAENIDWLKIAEGLQERYDMKDDRERIRYGRYLVRRGFPTTIVWQMVGMDQGG